MKKSFKEIEKEKYSLDTNISTNLVFASLFLRSDSTTVPLAAEKLTDPRDDFKKGFQKMFFLN